MANQLTYPTQFNQSVWSKQPGVVFTDAYSGFLAPDGTQTATLFVKGTQNTGEFEQKPTPQFVVNTTYTVSIWVYTAISGSATVQFKFWSGTANTTSGFLSVIASPAQWKRLTWTFTTPATLGSNPSMGLQSNATIATPGASIGIWGMQLEIGSSATDFVNSFPLTAVVATTPSRAQSQPVTLSGGLGAIKYGNDRNKLLYGNSFGQLANIGTFGDKATQWTFDQNSTQWQDSMAWFPTPATFSYWATVLGWIAVSSGATLTAPASAPDTRPCLAIALTLAANQSDGARYAFTTIPAGVTASYNQTHSAALAAAVLTGYLLRARVYIPAYVAAAPSKICFRSIDLNGNTRLSAPVTLPTAGGWVAVADYVENAAAGGAAITGAFNAATVQYCDLLVTAPAAAGITATLSVEYVDMVAAYDTPLPLSGRIVSYMTSLSATSHALTRPATLVPGRTYTASIYHLLPAGGATINPQFQFFSPTVALARFYWNISTNTLGWQGVASAGLLGLRQFANNLEVTVGLNSSTAPSAEVNVLFANVIAANPALATVANGEGSFNMAEGAYNVYGTYGTLGTQGNTMRLFVEDIAGKRRYSAPQTPTAAGFYFGDTISATTNLTGTTIDSGFDPTHIVRMGVVFLASGSAFTGAVQINVVNVSSQQLTLSSSFLTPHVGWQRFSWTFVAPTWATPNCFMGVLLSTSVGGYYTGFQLVEDAAPATYVPYTYVPRVDPAASAARVSAAIQTARAVNGLITCAPAYSKNTKPPANPYGLNLTAVSSYNPEWVFLDVWKQSTGWVESSTSSDVWDPHSHYGQAIPGLPVDANGWLLSLPAGMAVYNRMQGGNPHFPTGIYTVLFDGTGNIRYDSDAIGPHQCQLLASSPAGANTTQHLVQNNGGSTGILMKIDSCDPANPIRNIRVIMPGFANTYAAQIFHPRWLDRIKMFQTFRFMEWSSVNNSNVVNWSDRATPSYYYYCSSGLGVPMEMWIELCNRLLVDMWVCVPSLASDDYVYQMATLLKNTLNPSLRVWVEFGNEYWNGGFRTNLNCLSQGNAIGAGVAVFGAGASAFQTISAYYALRAVQCHNIFDAVFSGAYGLLQPINPYTAVKERRIKKVLGTQHDNPGVTDNVKQPALFYYGQTYKPDAVCGGYYFPPSISWTDSQGNALINSVDDLYAAATLKNAGMYADLVTQVAKCAAWGCDYVAYEGGGNWIPGNAGQFAIAAAANQDPRIATMYQTALAQWQALGGKAFNFFCSVGIDVQANLFSLLQYTDQPTTAALKYQAALAILQPDIKYGTHTLTPQAGAPRRRRRPDMQF